MSVKILKNYNLFIDSSQRDEGLTPSNFSIILRKPITKISKNSYFRVRIPSVVIPFSFSQINSAHNELSFSINSINYNVTIPNGNYNITNLLTTISNLMIIVVPTLQLNFIYTASTSKCTLGFGTTMTDKTFQMNYTGKNIIIMRMMGFTSNIIFSYIGGVYTNITSNQVVNVSPCKTLFIRSSTLIQNTNYESLVNKNDTTDILLQIPIITSFQTYINWTEQASDLFSEINNNVIDKINIYLSDSTSDDELPNDSGLLDWFIQINIQEIETDELINVEHITTNKYINQINKIEDDTLTNDKLINELNDKKVNIKKELDDLLSKKSNIPPG